MWNQKKVKFIRPLAEQGRDDFFNIFVLHQNRDYGRGKKNCVHESMIPEWMDLVIWGNEHECQPKLMESLVGTFRIFQPGSSIATSMVEGESLSNPKNMGILDVRGKQFRLNSVRYTQVRPFTFAELALREEANFEAVDHKVEEKISDLLSSKVNVLIKKTRQASSEVEAGIDGLKYRVKDPQKVLVRLKVDHAGFPTINQQRFGSKFFGDVANPSDLLSFSKKREYRSFSEAERSNRLVHVTEIDEGDEEINKVKIEELVNESLGQKSLGLLPEGDMAQALEDYVVRKAASAIVDVVEESLEKTQKEAFVEVKGDEDISALKIQQITTEYKKKSEERASNGQRKIRRANFGSADDDEALDDTKCSSKARATSRRGQKVTATKKVSSKGNSKSTRKKDQSEGEIVCPFYFHSISNFMFVQKMRKRTSK